MKIAVVTGASSGIGLSIALELRKAGYLAVNWDLQPSSQTDADIPFIACDVSSEERVALALKQTHERFGKVSVLVNNCGLQFMSPLIDFPKQKWDQLIGVMLTGTFLCTRSCLKDMIELNGGRIINISSVHGKLASPFKSAYVAAKHGVLGFAKVAAIEAAQYGVTVNTICPGFVDTPLMRKQVSSQMELNQLSDEEVMKKIFLKDQHIKQLTSPEQVSQFVVFLCSEAASTITGEAFNISGGWGMGL